MNAAKNKRYNPRHLAMLSILTALCYIGRIVFQGIPNVQPMTAILLILTLHMGVADGLVVTTLSLVLTNMMMGMGPWTFTQLATYAAVILFTGLVMRPFYQKKYKLLFVLFAFLVGIIYGFVISLVSYKTYGMTNFWAYYIYGLPFDFAHAAGNAGFYLILEPILRPLFKKYLSSGY